MRGNTAILFVLPVWSLLMREILRFLRQRNRIIGALGTPLLFWVVLGAGFGDLQLFFPGALLMVVLFTAIFASISIIEDRNEGFLQGVLVAPVSRLAIVLGKVLGGAILGCMQGVILLLLAPLSGTSYGPVEFIAAVGVIFLIAMALSALGFLFAWRMDSVQGFHAVMNLLLFPMWMLSGAFFPASGASTAIQMLMKINPLSYGLGALRRVLYGEAMADSLGDPSLLSSLGVTVGFAVLTMAVAVWMAGRPEKN
ncbi:MAG: ABC transporter permease [SAR324 cluster bacterium]|nr:ABC transporter permease [SAR324 cluster bacterium]